MFCWQTFSPFKCEYSCCGCFCLNMLTIIPALMCNWIFSPCCCIQYACDTENALYTGCFPAAGILYMPEGYEIMFHKTIVKGTSHIPTDQLGSYQSQNVNDSWIYDGMPASYGKIASCCGARMVCFSRKPDTECWSCWHERVLSLCGYTDLSTHMKMATRANVSINEIRETMTVKLVNKTTGKVIQ